MHPLRRSTMPGREQRAQVDDGLDVGPDHGDLGSGIGAVDGTEGRDTGVVDEDVDLESQVRHPTGQVGTGSGVGQVAGQDLDPDVVSCRQGVGQLPAASTRCGPPG